MKHEYLVLGAGPAGLQMGYYLKKNGHDYCILEATSEPAGFTKQFPRHGSLLTVNKRHTGYKDRGKRLRFDWNSLFNEDLWFPEYSEKYLSSNDEYVKYLCDYAEHHQLNITYNTRIQKISKQEGFTLVDTQREVHQCKYLLVATGLSLPYIPDIPGIAHTENYFDFSIDPKDFTDQRVLILGKGNSAFETATCLIPEARVIHLCSPNCIKMAWQTHYKGDIRAVNSAPIDTYHLKLQNTMLNAKVEWIAKKGDEFVVQLVYPESNNQIMVHTYDRILACTGFRFDDSIFDDSCKPNMTKGDKFPATTIEWESTNVNGLYFIGVTMGAKDQRKYFSSFVSGFRCNIRFLSMLLEQKNHDKALKRQTLPAEPSILAKHMLTRASNASALVTQSGFIGDAIVMSTDGNYVSYYSDLTMEYILQGELSNNEHYYTLTLEYGDFSGQDPLCVTRTADPDKGHDDIYTHPIIRRWCKSELIEEYHSAENLESDWQEFQFTQNLFGRSTDELKTMYQEKLTAFLHKQMKDNSNTAADYQLDYETT